MTADNWKPQKYLSQQPRDMRFIPFEEETPPVPVPNGAEFVIFGLCLVVLVYILASVL